jgi:hypothetical protein
MGLMLMDKRAAQRCFAEDPPGPDGSCVAEYWLSLWRGNELPQRADFRPRVVVDQLPVISIFEVVPGKSVHCRLHGSALAQGHGEDITGKDWLAMTEPEDRPMRLRRWSDVAHGAIGRGLRQGHRQSGEPQYSAEMMLPFADVAPDGSRQVLFHLSWRQTSYDPTLSGTANVNRLAVEFRLTDLRAIAADA